MCYYKQIKHSQHSTESSLDCSAGQGGLRQLSNCFTPLLEYVWYKWHIYHMYMVQIILLIAVSDGSLVELPIISEQYYACILGTLISFTDPSCFYSFNYYQTLPQASKHTFIWSNNSLRLHATMMKNGPPTILCHIWLQFYSFAATNVRKGELTCHTKVSISMH